MKRSFTIPSARQDATPTPPMNTQNSLSPASRDSNQPSVNDMTTAERKPSAAQLREIWLTKAHAANGLYKAVSTASRRLRLHDKAGYERGEAAAHHAKFSQLHNELAAALHVWESADQQASAAFQAYQHA